MSENITDQATATAALNKVRDALLKAVDNADSTTKALRDTIVRIRPSGVMTVDEMAEAVSRDRNFIDTVWSGFGEVEKGKQTRVALLEASDDEWQRVRAELASVARNHRVASGTANVMRADRNRVVAMVYASKLLGPSAIAEAVGIDRNHVLRTARKAGVKPAWRPAGTSRNQHTQPV